MINWHKHILDSEKRDEYIDFTMICVFFVFCCLPPHFKTVKIIFNFNIFLVK